jgi:multidrug efflux pump subunit AcrA (membrane-fusion protein)
VNGKVAQRLVQNGDRVHNGQALLVLDTNDLELQLEQAEAEVRAATTSLTQAAADEARTTTLNKDGWSTAAMLDKARAAAAEARGRLTRAQRAVELARNARSYATLEADEKHTATPRAWQVAAAGQPVSLAHTGEPGRAETFSSRPRATGSLTPWSPPGRSHDVATRVSALPPMVRPAPMRPDTRS